MEDSKGFRHYLQAAGKELRKPPGRHLTEEELLWLHQQGHLPEGEQAALRSHLVQCDLCLATFKEMRDFLASSPPDQQADPAEINRGWQAVWPQIRSERKVTKPEVRRWWTNLSFSPRPAFAFAAVLSAMLLVTVFWAFQLRRENQALTSQMQAAQQRSAEQIKALEQNQQQKQEQTNQQAAATKEAYDAQLAELRQPALNTPVYDLFSRDSTKRSGDARTTNEVTVPTNAKNFVLLLNGAGQPPSPTYQIEILNADQQVVWRGTGLVRDQMGSFSLTLRQEFLPPGSYRLRLYGQSGQRTQLITEYPLRIK